MKLTIVAFLILGTFLQKVQSDDAGKCDTSTCLIENNCRCSMLEGPLTLEETPQLIVLAFASAAKEDIYQKIWSPLVMARKNPDGEFISANFYINHEYSDYQIVHDLAVNGFEIGVHSVTNTVDQEYWRNATEELLEQEFGDQRKIMAKFANIPADKIRGTLTPQLQLNGDSSTTAFAKQGFTYDNSWPSKTHLYPYTLDYASGQDCTLGTKCPTQSYPGFWVAPIIDLQGQDGDVCATIFGCFRNSSDQSVEEISQWFVEQINAVKNDNKAPLTLIIEQNLFESVNNSYDALVDALDTIQKSNDVFFVSQSRVIEWLKNPEPLSTFKTAADTIETDCVKSFCNLKNEKDEERTMISCIPCPKKYPWLGNPEGN